MAKDKETPDGWSALADAFGVSRQQVWIWRKKPDAPKTPDDPAWPEWVDRNRVRSDGNLRDQKLQEEIAILKLKRRQAEGASMSIDEMGAFVARFSAKLDQLLTMKLETELPARIQGKEIVAVRQEVRAIHDEIREIYNAGLLEWKPKPS